MGSAARCVRETTVVARDRCRRPGCNNTTQCRGLCASDYQVAYQLVAAGNKTDEVSSEATDPGVFWTVFPGWAVLTKSMMGAAYLVRVVHCWYLLSPSQSALQT